MTFIYLMQGSIKKLIVDKESLKNLRNGICKKRVEILKLRSTFIYLSKMIQKIVGKEPANTGII